MYKIDVKQYVDDRFQNPNQFAKAINTERPTALKIYEGETVRISLDILYNMCKLFNCTPNDLIIDDEDGLTVTEKINQSNNSLDDKKKLNIVYQSEHKLSESDFFAGKEALKQKIYELVLQNLQTQIDKSFDDTIREMTKSSNKQKSDGTK